MPELNKSLISKIMIVIGVAVNLLSSYWITQQLSWLNINPPSAAAAGAIGAFLFATVIPLLLSWVVLIYAGYIKKESEI